MIACPVYTALAEGDPLEDRTVRANVNTATHHNPRGMKEKEAWPYCATRNEICTKYDEVKPSNNRCKKRMSVRVGKLHNSEYTSA